MTEATSIKLPLGQIRIQKSQTEMYKWFMGTFKYHPMALCLEIKTALNPSVPYDHFRVFLKSGHIGKIQIFNEFQ